MTFFTLLQNAATPDHQSVIPTATLTLEKYAPVFELTFSASSRRVRKKKKPAPIVIEIPRVYLDLIPQQLSADLTQNIWAKLPASRLLLNPLPVFAELRYSDQRLKELDEDLILAIFLSESDGERAQIY